VIRQRAARESRVKKAARIYNRSPLVDAPHKERLAIATDREQEAPGAIDASAGDASAVARDYEAAERIAVDWQREQADVLAGREHDKLGWR
jgi:hypothetical protein